MQMQMVRISLSLQVSEWLPSGLISDYYKTR